MPPKAMKVTAQEAWMAGVAKYDGDNTYVQGDREAFIFPDKRYYWGTVMNVLQKHLCERKLQPPKGLGSR